MRSVVILALVLTSDCIAAAADPIVVEGVVQQKGTSQATEFFYIRSDHSSAFGYQVRQPNDPSKIMMYLGYLDDNNPFGVLIETRRPNVSLTPTFTGKEVFLSAQESSTPDNRPPKVVDLALLGVIGLYHQLNFEDRVALISAQTNPGKYCASVQFEQSPNACKTFKILQDADSLLYNSPNSKSLGSYDFRGEASKGKYKSIRTTVTYQKPINFAAGELGDFAVELDEQSTTGEEWKQDFVVNKLKVSRSHKKAESLIDGLYSFLGTGKSVISKANVQLAIDHGKIMVAVDKDSESRISALSYFVHREKRSMWFWTLGCCIFLTAIIAAVAIWRRSK